MTRDPCLKLCLSEIQWARSVFCCDFAQCLSLKPEGLYRRAAQDIPRLSLCGTAGEASTSRCFGRVLPSKGSVRPPGLSRCLSSLGMEAMARPGIEMEGVRRGGETASDTFSAVSNLIHSISQFINICMFSLPNLTALWKIKGLLDQQSINQALNLQVIGKKPTKRYLDRSAPNTAL